MMISAKSTRFLSAAIAFLAALVIAIAAAPGVARAVTSAGEAEAALEAVAQAADEALAPLTPEEGLSVQSGSSYLRDAGKFAVAAAGQDGGYIIEPTLVSYTEGQSVQAALEASGLGFTFNSVGTLEAVAGVAPVAGSYMYSFTDYGDEGLLGKVDASSITALFISSHSDAGIISDGQVVLLDAIGEFAVRTDGVRNYELALFQNARALVALPKADSATAAEIAGDFRDAIAAYDAIMAGPRHTVTFTVTGRGYLGATVTLVDVYGNETRAARTSTSGAKATYKADVVEMDNYRYSVMSTDGLDGVRCKDLDVAGDITQTAQIPSADWFKTAVMYTKSGGGTPDSPNCTIASGSVTDRSVTYLVPDATRPLADLYIKAANSSEATNYPLYAVYERTDGEAGGEVQIVNSTAGTAPGALVATGPEAVDFALEVRSSNSANVYQVEICTVRIKRVPTLADLSVVDRGAELVTGFSPYKTTYDVYTASGSLTVAPTAFGSTEEGYRVSLNGNPIAAGGCIEIEVPESARTTPLSVPVTVSLEGGAETTYTVKVHKADARTVKLTHAAGVSVEVRNSAGGTVAPEEAAATYATYRLVDYGEDYTYIGTKDDYFHVTNSFAPTAATVAVPTPKTTNMFNRVVAASSSSEKTWTAFGTGEGASLHDLRGMLDDASNGPVYLMGYTTAAARWGMGYAVGFLDQRSGAWNGWSMGTSGTVNYKTPSTDDGTGAISRIHMALKGTEAGAKSAVAASGQAVHGYLRVDTETGSAGETHYQTYDVTLARQLTLPSLVVSANGETLVMTRTATEDLEKPVTGYVRDVYDYTVSVPEGTDTLSLSYTFRGPDEEGALYEGGYHVTTGNVTQDYKANATMRQDVRLDTQAYEQTVDVRVSHDDPDTPDAVYRIKVRQLPKVAVQFDLDPADATVTLTDDLTGLRVSPVAGKTYSLTAGYSYSWTAGAVGHVGKGGTITATDGLVVKASLPAVEQNPSIDPTIPSEWPYFRADANNNSVVIAKIPTKSDDALLYWAAALGSGYNSSGTGCPILVDGYIYAYAGDKIYKVDCVTGETVAQGTMVGTSNFAITPMTYGEGMVFVALSNGRVEAFNADTLESLWVYQSPKGGQPNCPIAYRNGLIYTGFWNFDSVCDFVCLTVTDEDPTTPGSGVVDDPDHPGQSKTAILDEKMPLWTYAHQGGFYWAGAWAGDDYVVVGSDEASISAGLEITDEGKGSGTVYSFDARTGEVIDTISSYPGGVCVGNIRSTIVCDPDTSMLYWCGRGGYLCSVGLNADGTFDKASMPQPIYLGTGSGAVSSTSTPVICNGRAYVGADSGAYDDNGQFIAVIDLGTRSVAYKVGAGGRTQASGLLTSGYAGEDGYYYFYFVDNYPPGRIHVFKDKPGQSMPVELVEETTSDGTRVSMAPTVFAPQRSQSQYCICSLICDDTGTIYFKNDTGQMMAVGPTIKSLEVVEQPTHLRVGKGDTFNPDGMKVVAHYSNGTERDVTDYVSYTTEPLDQLGEISIPIVFEHTMYQAGTVNQEIGNAPDYNYRKPSTSVKVTVVGELAPEILTAELPVAEADDGDDATYEEPFSVTFTASGTPRTFTWSTSDSVTLQAGEKKGIPSGLKFDAKTATLSGMPAKGTGGVYRFAVVASNGVKPDARKEFVLTVAEKPSMVTAANALPEGKRDQEYGINELKATGYPLPLAWFVQEGWHSTAGWDSHLPEGLTLEQTGDYTARLAGTPTESGSFYTRVYVRTAHNKIAVPRAYLVVVNGEPRIDTATVPNAGLGVAYSFAFEADAYPEPTWSWKADDGSSLPAGLELDPSTGTVSGTPTATGDYSVLVTATNSFGSDTAALTLSVSEPAAPAIVTEALPAAALDAAYEAELTVSGSPYPAVEVAGLPEGLAYDREAGLIAGEPTVAGTFNVTVTAENTEGSTEKTFSLIVKDGISIGAARIGAPVAEGADNEGFVVAGEQADINLSIFGSPAPEVTVSGLPDGLTYNEATGHIVGTPTTASVTPATVVVDAENGVGMPVQATYLVRVYERPAIAATSLAAGRVGEAYSSPLGVTGTPAPTVSIAGGDSGLGYDSATDSLAGVPTMYGERTVTVTVSNDVAARSYRMKLTVNGPLTLIDDALPAAVIGKPYTAQVRAGGYPRPTVTVSGLPQGLEFDKDYATDNGAIVGTPAKAGTSTITIGLDNGLEKATFTRELVVEELISVTAESLADATALEPYSQTVAMSGPVSGLVAEGLPEGLEAVREAGGGFAIAGTPAAAGTYQVRLIATSEGGQQAEKTLTLTVLPPREPALIACDQAADDGTLAAVSAGEEFSIAFSATGNPSTFSWRIIDSAALPEGVFLATGEGSATATLSGTVSAGGIYWFQIGCSNGFGDEDVRAFALVVEAPASLPAQSLEPAYVGQEYVAALEGVGGYPSPTFSLAKGEALPAGLALDGATGVISGTPAQGQGGVCEIRIVASNGIGDSASQTLALTVYEPPALVTAGLPATMPGLEYRYPIAVIGHEAPTIVVDGLPAGLSYNPETGCIEGQATESGTFNVTFALSNPLGEATASLELQVLEDFAVVVAALPEGTVGEAYEADEAAIGVRGTFTGVSVSGLPEGLSFDAQGLVVSGVPETAGAYRLEVTVTGESDVVRTFPVTLEVGPPLEPVRIGCDDADADGNLTVVRPGAAFTFYFEATGNPSAFVWSLTDPAALPEGVSFAAGEGASIATLSGTAPAGGGTYPFEVRCSNGVEPEDMRGFTLVVEQPLSIGTSSLAKAWAGTAYEQAIEVAGPVSRLTAEGLPEGLALVQSGEGGYSIVGTPNEGAVGEHAVRIKATSPAGQVVATALTLEVGDTMRQAEWPEVASGLVYNGKEQVGVEAGEGFVISSGAARATKAGSYVAYVHPEDGWTWPDGTTDDIAFEWEISPAKVTVATLKSASGTYSGKAQQPTIKAVKAGALALTASDYKVTYKNAKGATVAASAIKNAGSYTVIVTGKGNFTGSAKATYTINKAAGTLTVTAQASTAKKALKAKASKNSTFVASKYVKVTKKTGALSYAKANKSGGSKIVVNVKNGKITVKKGLKKTTYTVKVKITSGATTNYKSTSKTVTVKIKVS